MSDDASIAHSEAAAADDGLQFDRVVTGASAAAGTDDGGVVCATCHMAIPAEYYDIRGHVVCDRCRRLMEAAAETPRGALPLLIAGAFGLGAGIAGAVIYYSVIAIAHLEIGLIAILIGYMVGYAVRRGAGGRGGLRFQILAVALTYASVAFAYTPLVVTGARDRQARQSATAGSAQSDPGSDAALASRPGGAPRSVGAVGPIAMLTAFVVTLPILVIVSSLPSGLITAVIIFIGMRQAWRMTAAPLLEVRGPYRVGAQPAGSA
jgi:hypothetical protein